MRAALVLAALLIGACAQSGMALRHDCEGEVKRLVKGRNIYATLADGSHLAFRVSRVQDGVLYGREDDPALPLAQLRGLSVYKPSLWIAGESLLSWTPVALLTPALENAVQSTARRGQGCK